MNEILTIEEMEEKYAGFWVLIGDPELDEQQQLRGGRVLFHSPNGDEVSRKLNDYPKGRYGFRCFVKPPEGMVFVL